MPIKNKDGTEYKLQGPNKIMKEQSFWDRNGVVLLNMDGWKEVVYKDQQVTPIKVMEEFMARLSPNEITLGQIKQEAEQPKPEPPVVIELPPERPKLVEPPVVKPRVEIEEIQQPLVSQNEKIALRKKTFECLPVHFRKVVDELYGEEGVETVFGTKFTFEAVPMENNDLTFSFWAKQKLENGSIVFQSGIERHARWWQVQKCEPDSGGFIITTIISSINPDFSA
jgi:hypothetical protein